MSDSYQDLGFAVLRGVISSDLVDFLALHLAMRYRVGGLEGDPQVPGSASVYGDPAFEALLASLVPTVSSTIARDVLPTYSFVRIYERGQDLAQHSDRPACEHSVTLHLGASGVTEWPIYLRGLDGLDAAVNLRPGDALVYRGCEVQHWREPCPEAWFAQAFLHYVDSHGPYASHVFDRRPYLGLERSSKVA